MRKHNSYLLLVVSPLVYSSREGLRRPVKAKAPLRVQLLLTFGGRGEEQEASALLSKKEGGREGSIESQQKFDFFKYDSTTKLYTAWLRTRPYQVVHE